MLIPEQCTLTEEFSNLKIDDIVTPIKVEHLRWYLSETRYDQKEPNFLLEGFTNGFSLEYKGKENRCDEASNIPFTLVDNSQDLWDKLMKEVRLGRLAGPFDRKDLPYTNYIQSPIGLVPKHGGKTRLIFHLSYQFKNGNPSVNQCTPRQFCTVKYNDLDMMIKQCCKLNAQVFWAKTDVQSAFRLVPLKVQHRKYLIMQATHPHTRKTHFFIEKNLPFGHSISCCHFQRFSNCNYKLLRWLFNCKHN